MSHGMVPGEQARYQPNGAGSWRLLRRRRNLFCSNVGRLCATGGIAALSYGSRRKCGETDSSQSRCFETSNELNQAGEAGLPV